MPRTDAELEAKALRKAERQAKRERKADAVELAPSAAHAPPAKRTKPADAAAATTKAGADAAELAAGAAYLAAHEIVIHDPSAPPPCLEFARAPFPQPIVALLCARPGFVTPSAVQAASWPIAATGRDVLAIAKTGSGKTLGFLLPVLARCAREKPRARGAPLALIMAPTRELAIQIADEAKAFGKAVDCTAVVVYGGAARTAQVNALQRGCELIVGTPGRVADVLDLGRGGGGGARACVSVESLSALVLDEADRMLDMGFERDIRRIVCGAFARRARQTLFYSATWPAAVQAIAADLLREPVKVTVGAGGDKLTASKSVTQRVHVVTPAGRWDALCALLAQFGAGGAHAGERVLVFANMKSTVGRIAEYCVRAGLKADSISGDRSQSQREATLRKFKSGDVTVVIATDVAARGLDIKGIERVINYELPADDFQDYIHRIGRTGRAGASGVADTLFTDGDRSNAKELIRILTEAGQDVPAALAKYTPQSIKFVDSDDE